jgi:hypothetical protein
MTERPNETGPRTPALQPAYDPPQRPRRGHQRASLGDAMVKSFIRSMAASIGTIIVRMILGRRR